ncbi:metalloregulator ArsR/SmtB family transcription factor [Flavobacteriaceae bacterium]|nr:metalloregulator ArsR/SmtB family transcription factor [Flavobacteriaceae bacterium]MDA9213086.1 metalloregulator ArsR/SmtB family transcription factor [Flavobacteriaceae bacterium]MDB4007090.1 metalloregulator ArsR/SmtB family transcription factor [Flavobacteriaceae bacterium]MDB4023842.1 metalloregulator ArsR/SmtB family transcription factor [Flavobacteriaceae bacterium]MDB4130839.1 metalloregulator ArsR/SmtB family transcription factor [Flavobacteriaceae bacterium]
MKSTKRQFSVLKLQQVAKILKTISHPVKLEILEVLESNEPLDVGSICDKIGINCEISMMSHHLSKMKDNGVLVSEKKGKQVFYKIADRQLLSIFDCMEGCDLF